MSPKAFACIKIEPTNLCNLARSEKNGTQFRRRLEMQFVYFVHKTEIGILRDNKTRKTITGVNYGNYV